mmetsp:Transcript_13308/g.25518  ORF Transcript_13308/g.25518 Transcript_13308/m.25518 type:complete len:215 (-) Transcript_13308:369-1013(-)
MVVPAPARLKPHAVHRRVHFGHAQNLLNLLRHAALGDVHHLAAERFRLRQALGDHVPHDDARRPKEMAGGCARQPHRACARHVHRGPWTHSRRVRPVETCWENIREKREIANLLDSLILIRELEQVEVCVRDHHVLRLPSDPTSHVHVAVCGAWTSRVDIEANACVAALARHASSAGNVERDRAQVSFLDELHILACLNNLTGYLMPKHHMPTR